MGAVRGESDSGERQKNRAMFCDTINNKRRREREERKQNVLCANRQSARPNGENASELERISGCKGACYALW